MEGSKYYSPADGVSCVRLAEYEPTLAEEALRRALEPIGGLELVKPGMTVVIKANLVSAMKPEEAATTHPVLLQALTRMLKEKGATVILGDSPGGVYTKAFVSRVYKLSGMHEVESEGAELNDDFSQVSAEFPEGKVLKSFTYKIGRAHV